MVVYNLTKDLALGSIENIVSHGPKFRAWRIFAIPRHFHHMRLLQGQEPYEEKRYAQHDTDGSSCAPGARYWHSGEHATDEKTTDGFGTLEAMVCK
jgi:hypothetical protein